MVASPVALSSRPRMSWAHSPALPEEVSRAHRERERGEAEAEAEGEREGEVEGGGRGERERGRRNERAGTIASTSQHGTYIR